LQEGVYGNDLLTVVFQSPNCSPDTLIGKDVSFSFEYGGRKEFFNGIVTSCSKEQPKGGASIATLKAKTLRHLLDKEKKSAVYCKTNVEEIAKSILGKTGISASKCSLSKYYETDFKVQYNESDLNFLQRLFEEHGIIEFVQHSSSSSELAVSDSNDFTASDSSFVKCRLESTETGNILYGYSHAPVRTGMSIDSFGETFIVYSAAHAGSQEAAFGIKGKTDGYSCQIMAFSKHALSSVPRIKEKPNVPGVIVAQIEGFKDSPAHIDSQGRYIIRMPFDEENKDMSSSTPVHLAQGFAGAGYGVHFPLRRGTPVLIAFEDGDIDKPIALGALPKDLCKGPADNNKSFRNILRTISGIEIVFDDEAKSLSVETPECISAKAGKELALKAGKVMKMEADDITIKANSKLVLQGKKVEIN
jgi:uncharacterized protein involved in type VI secretion and phage assembly